MDASLDFGMLLAAIFVVCLVYGAWHFRDAALRRRLLPWLACGAYSIGTALAIAMGRVWLTKSGINAVSGRYLLHAVPLMMAVPALVWVIGCHLDEKFPGFHQAIRQTLLALLVALAVTQLAGWHYGERMMEFWSSSCMRRSVNTLFYKTSCPIEHDYVSIPDLERVADDLGLLNPPMLKNLRLDNFKVSSYLLNYAYSQLSSMRIEKADDGLYINVQGHAMFPKEWRVADGVLLACLDPKDGHWEIFRVTQVSAMPLYLVAAYAKDLEYTYASSSHPSESLSAFDARFKMDDLPKGVCRVAAWAYDYRTRRASLIPGFYEVDTIKGTVKPLGTNAEALGFLPFQAAHR